MTPCRFVTPYKLPGEWWKDIFCGWGRTHTQRLLWPWHKEHRESHRWKELLSRSAKTLLFTTHKGVADETPGGIVSLYTSKLNYYALWPQASCTIINLHSVVNTAYQSSVIFVSQNCAESGGALADISKKEKSEVAKMRAWWDVSLLLLCPIFHPQRML